MGETIDCRQESVPGCLEPASGCSTERVGAVQPAAGMISGASQELFRRTKRPGPVLLGRENGPCCFEDAGMLEQVGRHSSELSFSLVQIPQVHPAHGCREIMHVRWFQWFHSHGI